MKPFDYEVPFKDIWAKEYQNFNDGIATICEVKNVAERGDQPKQGLSQKVKLRFQYKTVGLTRYYTAQQLDIKIAETIIVPQNRNISTHDVVILTSSSRQYYVEQVQHKDDTFPKTTLLSLSELEERYDTTGV